jgi:hypothetical protein
MSAKKASVSGLISHLLSLSWVVSMAVEGQWVKVCVPVRDPPVAVLAANNPTHPGGVFVS